MTTYVAYDAITPYGYSQITNLSAVIGIEGGNGRVALLQAIDQNIRWRDDGTDPTASIGMRLHAGETFLYNGDLAKIRFIEETAGAELNISRYQ